MRTENALGPDVEGGSGGGEGSGVKELKDDIGRWAVLLVLALVDLDLDDVSRHELICF